MARPANPNRIEQRPLRHHPGRADEPPTRVTDKAAVLPSPLSTTRHSTAQPYRFDLDDGLHELMIKTDSPSPPLPDTLSSVLLVDNHSRWRWLIALQLVQMGVTQSTRPPPSPRPEHTRWPPAPRDLAILHLDSPTAAGST